MDKTTYIRLSTLAYRLGVPRSFVRREADAGRIPFIQTGKKRRLFNQAQVEQALHEHAAQAVRQEVVHV